MKKVYELLNLSKFTLYFISDLNVPSMQFAGEVKCHNLIIGSKHTTSSQWDDGLFGTKTYVLHNRMTSSLPQRMSYSEYGCYIESNTLPI